MLREVTPVDPVKEREGCYGCLLPWIVLRRERDATGGYSRGSPEGERGMLRVATLEGHVKVRKGGYGRLLSRVM